MQTERVFEIKTLKSMILKSLFETIKPYIKETNIVINKDGLKISTMDPSKVSLTYIKLDAKKFESYYCERPVIVGIDTNVLFKTIKSANRRETITFYVNKSDEDNLGIELADPFMGKVKDYKIPMLALDEKVINIPEMSFDYVINIPSAHFQQIIKDIQLLEGKVVEIKSLSKQLIFSCEDGLASFKTAISEIDDSLNKDQRTLLEQNGEIIRSVKFEKSLDKIVQGRYKLSHLMNFIKASHLCDNMNILLKNDKPLILEYFVADLGIMRFLLCGVTE
ncbi:proliferating cell nuclear antigen (pcna) [bacterium]|nr:proliferating cell nuclear antigen (pcna) [bacterium]NDC93759.1 proliferating cell nuclear antigen (pcna) [bacterium]NDD83092.1 proliferating cell nuclear antigen (pcna) [bacterium]NDG29507.1 proliferating cell nuclear antigen (pcna) [bacterium]